MLASTESHTVENITLAIQLLNIYRVFKKECWDHTTNAEVAPAKIQREDNLPQEEKRPQGAIPNGPIKPASDTENGSGSGNSEKSNQQAAIL